MDEIRQLIGQKKCGDVGIFTLLAGFTPDTNSNVSRTSAHIKMIYKNRLIGIRNEFNQDLDEGEKGEMKLETDQFVNPN